MTNHATLYTQAQKKLAVLPYGRFRLTDICDNPPTRLGLTFRTDVVVKKRYPNVRQIIVDEQSVIYEKFDEEREFIE